MKTDEDTKLTAEIDPITTYVARLMRDAFEARASDIHLDPREGGDGRVRIRVDGVLRETDAPPAGEFAAVVNRIKTMCCMELEEKRLPQDGRMLANVKGRDLDFRVSTLPAHYGERVCMRILDKAVVQLNLGKVIRDEGNLATIRRLVNLPNGIVISNGPTGSGKTTLLYAMLSEINQPGRCILTVEDPVEYVIDGVSQTAVRPSSGLTFARVIRSMLRQDPDVLMIGEIRDLETLCIGAQAALTGHLVMSTLHAQTSPGAVERMIDMGMERFLVNSAVAGIVSQRLVRLLCQECRQEGRPPEHSTPPEAVRFIDELDESTLFVPAGCEKCNGSGYRGRRAIHEILVMNDEIREAVGAGGGAAEIREAARRTGMRSLLEDGLKAAAKGQTSVAEILRVVPYESLV